MHATNTSARVPALELTKRQQSTLEMLHAYEEERSVEFRAETYLVRDNGAVLRRACANARRRKLDEVWTFGTLSKTSGYLMMNGHVVHQIVASAFHGARPSAEHVVDHIDTNRQNNRAENLRWVTRLENILLNPITRRRIELAFGTLEAFFENPHAKSITDWSWMRTVTKEQAQESLRRLRQWAKKGQARGAGSLGDWLFEANPIPSSPPEERDRDTPSVTPAAFQRDWRTPTEFPHCPGTVTDTSLEDYRERLVFGAVFACNQYGKSVVVASAIGLDGCLSVLCNTQTGVKDWTLAKVFVEARKYCHQSSGTFFTLQGALKAHCAAIGETFEESIDEYC